MLDSCPLVDKKGKPLKLNSIKYIHLSQLQNEQIEEGYTVEYKSIWDKKFIDTKLCQTIASFANSSGGWLFVGISDDREICEIAKEKYDFSQQIASILSAHVSPIPNFECRFIKEKATSTTGVLVIQIFEGKNPPYVSKGTVYIRNGSSRTPINANRADIDNLFKKSNDFKMNFDKLLSSPISSHSTKNPFCIIALSNIKGIDYQIQLKDIDRIESRVKDLKIFPASIRTAESIIFLVSDLINPNSVTSYVELFFNTSIRIVMYFPCYSKYKRDQIKDYILSQTNRYNIGDYVLLDFYASTNFINSIVSSTVRVIDCANQQLRHYSMQCEFRNTRDTLLYFEPLDEFYDQIVKYGMKFSLKDTQRTFIEQISKTSKVSNESALISLAYKYFSQAFGYYPIQFIELYNRLLDNHPECFNVSKNSFTFDYERT